MVLLEMMRIITELWTREGGVGDMSALYCPSLVEPM